MSIPELTLLQRAEYMRDHGRSDHIKEVGEKISQHLREAAEGSLPKRIKLISYRVDGHLTDFDTWAAAALTEIEHLNSDGFISRMTHQELAEQLSKTILQSANSCMDKRVGWVSDEDVSRIKGILFLAMYGYWLEGGAVSNYGDADYIELRRFCNEIDIYENTIKLDSAILAILLKLETEAGERNSIPENRYGRLYHKWNVRKVVPELVPSSTVEVQPLTGPVD